MTTFKKGDRVRIAKEFGGPYNNKLGTVHSTDQDGIVWVKIDGVETQIVTSAGPTTPPGVGAFDDRWLTLVEHAKEVRYPEQPFAVGQWVVYDNYDNSHDPAKYDARLGDFVKVVNIDERPRKVVPGSSPWLVRVEDGERVKTWNVDWFRPADDLDLVEIHEDRDRLTSELRDSERDRHDAEAARKIETSRADEAWRVANQEKALSTFLTSILSEQQEQQMEAFLEGWKAARS